MNKIGIIIYIAITLGFVMAQFFTALFCGNLIDSLSIYNYETFIKQSCLAIILLFALLTFNIIKRNYAEKLKYGIVNQKKKRILKNLSEHPLSLLVANEIGYYTNIFQGDINKYERLYINNILFFPERIMMIFLCVVLLLLFDIRILLFTVLITCVMIVLPNIFNKNIRKYSENYGDSVKQISEELNDFINNSSEYLLFEATDAAENGFEQRSALLKHNKFKLYFTLVIQNNLSLIFSLALSVGILIFASYLKQVSISNMQISSLSLSFVAGLFADNVLEFVDNYNKFKAGKTFKNILEKHEKQYEDIGNKNYLTEPIQKIVYKDFYVYKNKSTILMDVDLVFKKGNKYLVVGESGAGKSTLIQSLLGLSEYSGDIFINDINIRDLNYRSLYNEIAYINGNGRVFNASLIENITLFDDDINLKLINEIYELLELSALPQNVDDNKLSGGERQRILIARALYRNCQIIIIDEATSELDNETQYRIEKYFIKQKNKTVINISHKICDSLIGTYDFIVVMEQCRVKIISN